MFKNTLLVCNCLKLLRFCFWIIESAEASKLHCFLNVVNVHFLTWLHFEILNPPNQLKVNDSVLVLCYCCVCVCVFEYVKPSNIRKIILWCLKLLMKCWVGVFLNLFLSLCMFEVSKLWMFNCLNWWDLHGFNNSMSEVLKWWLCCSFAPLNIWHVHSFEN